MVHDGQAVALEAPETRLLFALPIVALALAGARHSARLMRQTFAVLAAVTLSVPAVLSIIAVAAPAGEHYAQLWIAVETCAAAGWSALALQAWTRRRFSGESIWSWVTVGLVLMATTEVVKAWSLADAQAPVGLAAYLQLTAAGVAVTAALKGLWSSVRADSVDSGDLTRALVDTQRQLAQLEQLQRRRLHDARSAVMGVVGASRLLDTPGLTWSVDPTRLRSMVNTELDRLQGLLEEQGCRNRSSSSTWPMRWPWSSSPAGWTAPSSPSTAGASGSPVGRGPPPPSSTTCCAMRTGMHRAHKCG